MAEACTVNLFDDSFGSDKEDCTAADDAASFKSLSSASDECSDDEDVFSLVAQDVQLVDSAYVQCFL